MDAIVTSPPEASGVVVAGPGGGKTSAILARAAHLVARGLSADDVLVLTPTRVGATALRDELALRVGAATSGPMARSLSSLAFQIVRAASVRAGLPAPALLTGGDEDQILADLLEGDVEDEASGAPSRWPAQLPPAVRATRAFRGEVRAFFAECTTLGIDPARLDALGRSGGIEAWPALAGLAREYLDVRAQMRVAHRDPATLLHDAANLIRDGDEAALEVVRARRVLLIDDAQELTVGGVALLAALAAREVGVMAFGDPDVASGSFRGAGADAFGALCRALGVLAAPPELYRGTPAQRALLRRIVPHIGAGPVVAHRRPAEQMPPDDSTRTFVLRSAAEEYDVVARLLRERHVHESIPWSRIAVIAHDSRQVAAWEVELAARDVPSRVAGPGAALGSLGPVRRLLALVAHAIEGEDPDPLRAAELLRGAGLDAVEVRRLRSRLRQRELAEGGNRSGGELLAAALAAPGELVLIDTREARRAERVAQTIALIREARDAGASVHELLWVAWDRSGLERTWVQASRGSGPLAEQAHRDLDAVVSLFQAAKRFGERASGHGVEPIVFIRRLQDSDVAEDRIEAAATREAVRVLTPAAAVGVDFDTVVVAGVQDGVWPNTRVRGSLLSSWRLADAHAGRPAPEAIDRRRDVLHDEIRLFLRALSRARARVVVTAVDDDDTGPSALLGLLPAPSDPGALVQHPLTLRGLVAAHRRTLTDPYAGASAREHAAAQLVLLADAGVPGADPSQWYGVPPVSTIAPARDAETRDVRVSPSRLHALEQCQLDWVIQDLGGGEPSAAAGLGTIVHAALETASEVSYEALWRVVDQRWDELEFDSAWRERAERDRARELVRRLHAYLRRFESEGGRLLQAEPHFEVPISWTDDAGESAHGIVLSGDIDRVELTARGEVVIVDLKTGKREPVRDDKVRDHPQLAAYQLAFEAGLVGAGAGHTAGGAKLLVLRPPSGSDARTPWQPPLDDERRAAFLARVRDAAHVMSGTSFLAPYEDHCRDDHTHGVCRIHTVSAVSSS